jgi:hypothetical protein
MLTFRWFWRTVLLVFDLHGLTTLRYCLDI